jgi:outer membrane lipoprotein-sorting protein
MQNPRHAGEAGHSEAEVEEGMPRDGANSRLHGVKSTPHPARKKLFMATKWQRWIPAVAVPAVVAAAVLGGAFATSANADLPQKTPQEVLQLAAQSTVQTFSGTVQATADLGLPDLSSVPGGVSGGSAAPSASGGSGAAGLDASVTNALSLLTGTHTSRVYVDGPTQARVQLLDQLSERDAVRNGNDLWLYDSSDNSVVHSTLPDKSGADASPDPTATQNPADLAQKLLAAVDPSTDVTLGANEQVAGRDAYDLVLTPRTSDTLVGTVSIAVDASTGLPLGVDVTARGASAPSLNVAFTDLSLDAPSADTFAFTPPAGATITEKPLDASSAPQAGSGADHPKPIVTGTGWASIVELPSAAGGAGDLTGLTSDPLFSQLTTQVDGGHVLQTTLVSVLLTDDGRVFAGAVSADALQAAAQAAPAATPAQ